MTKKQKINQNHSKKLVQNEEQQTLQQAVQLHQQGQVAQAITIYQRLLQHDPTNHKVLNLLGLVAFQNGRQNDALLLLTHAVVYSPHTAKYHYDLAVVLQSGGELKEAVDHYRAALTLSPNYLEALENLGVALFDKGNFSEAVTTFEKALRLNETSLLALTNLATLLSWQGNRQQALSLLDRAIEVNPVHSEARMKRAAILLALGDFQRGWDEYAWRFIAAGRPEQDKVHFVPLPRWDGQSLQGKKLLIHAEQGVGDEVMFASCLPDLQALEGAYQFLCDPRLVPVFQRSFPGIEILPNHDGDWGKVGENIAADFRVPLGDLPRFFRRTSAEFPEQKNYLKADPVLIRAWQDRLDDLGPGLKVGISWRGGRAKYAQYARTIPLALWEPLFQREEIIVINLQYGNYQEEIAALPQELRTRIVNFPDLDPLVDLESFFSLISSLDLVISIDNSTVHFAGSLGVPTWALLPALAEWRWGVTGRSCLWYKSVHLFRQRAEQQGEWQPVMQEVTECLSSELFPKRQKVALPVTPHSPKQPFRFASGAEMLFPPRALLLNDTSFWYHWGCTCTSLALRRSLQQKGWDVKAMPINSLGNMQPLPDKVGQLDDDGIFTLFCQTQGELCSTLEQADVVVVNGEGSLHGASRLALSLLYLAYIARTRFHKPVHIINHSCYPNNGLEPTGSELEKMYQQVYAAMDHVVVREPLTATVLSNLGVEATLGFDCLPLFVQEYRSYIPKDKSERLLIAGSVAWNQEMLQAVCALAGELAGSGIQPCFLFGANAYPAGDDQLFISKMNAERPGQIELIHAKSAIEWLSVIASARLLVSGRFHHSIAAACLRTPFVILDSNTPKIDGLMQVLELQTRLNSNSSELVQRLSQLASNLLADPSLGLITEEVHARILSLAHNNFTKL